MLIFPNKQNRKWQTISVLGEINEKKKHLRITTAFQVFSIGLFTKSLQDTLIVDRVWDIFVTKPNKSSKAIEGIQQNKRFIDHVILQNIFMTQFKL